MNKSANNVLPYVASFIAGLAICLSIALISGRKESWDAPIYFTIGIPAMCVVIFIISYRFPQRAWRWALSMAVGQSVAMVLGGGSASLWPLAIIAMTVVSLPQFIVARVASGIVKKRTPPGEPGARAVAEGLLRLFLLVVGDFFAQLGEFFAGEETQLVERSALLFRLGEVVLHQVELAEVFACAAVFGVEGQRPVVMFQRDLEIARVALGITQQILDVGIVAVALGGGVQRGNRARPVLGVDGFLAGGVIRVGFRRGGGGAFGAHGMDQRSIQGGGCAQQQGREESHGSPFSRRVVEQLRQ
jgi:hypothetical protein